MPTPTMRQLVAELERDLHALKGAPFTNKIAAAERVGQTSFRVVRAVTVELDQLRADAGQLALYVAALIRHNGSDLASQPYYDTAVAIAARNLPDHGVM